MVVQLLGHAFGEADAVAPGLEAAGNACLARIWVAESAHRCRLIEDNVVKIDAAVCPARQAVGVNRVKPEDFQ